MRWGWVIVIVFVVAAIVLINRKRVMQQLNIQLSKNFNLGEFVRTYTGFENIPDQEHIAALQALVNTILQPLRDAVGKPISITSGYRNPAVNAAVGGSKSSQHMKGEAADFRITGMTNAEIIRIIQALRLPYDQLIEYNKKGSTWIHVSHKPNGSNRLAWLRNDDGVLTPVKTGLA